MEQTRNQTSPKRRDWKKRGVALGAVKQPLCQFLASNGNRSCEDFTRIVIVRSEKNRA